MKSQKKSECCVCEFEPKHKVYDEVKLESRLIGSQQIKKKKKMCPERCKSAAAKWRFKLHCVSP